MQNEQLDNMNASEKHWNFELKQNFEDTERRNFIRSADNSPKQDLSKRSTFRDNVLSLSWDFLQLRTANSLDITTRRTKTAIRTRSYSINQPEEENFANHRKERKCIHCQYKIQKLTHDLSSNISQLLTQKNTPNKSNICSLSNEENRICFPMKHHIHPTPNIVISPFQQQEFMPDANSSRNYEYERR